MEFSREPAVEGGWILGPGFFITKKVKQNFSKIFVFFS